MKPYITISIITFFICSSFVLSTQSRHHNDIKIEINSPLKDQVFYKGDTIFLKAKITSSHPLHDVNSTLSIQGQSPLFQDNMHTHQNNVVYEKYYIQNLKMNSKLVLKVFLKDHSGNISAIDSVVLTAKGKTRK